MENYDALILNLDGSKKFSDIGSICAFIENNVHFNAIASASTGVINASFLASMDMNNIVKFWMEVINKNLFKSN